MSKGLGKIERAILQQLEKGYSGVNSLAVEVFHQERKLENGDFTSYDITSAVYKSTLRALNSLERKGLIKSVKITSNMAWAGDPTWYKLYALKDGSFPELEQSNITGQTYLKRKKRH